MSIRVEKKKVSGVGIEVDINERWKALFFIKKKVKKRKENYLPSSTLQIEFINEKEFNLN